jgi:hypothetical protein
LCPDTWPLWHGMYLYSFIPSGIIRWRGGVAYSVARNVTSATGYRFVWLHFNRLSEKYFQFEEYFSSSILVFSCSHTGLLSCTPNMNSKKKCLDLIELFSSSLYIPFILKEVHRIQTAWI